MGNIISRLPYGGSNNGNGIEIKNGTRVSVVSAENIEEGNFVEFFSDPSDYSAMFQDRNAWEMQNVDLGENFSGILACGFWNFDDEGRLILGALKKDDRYIIVLLEFSSDKNAFEVTDFMELLNENYKPRGTDFSYLPGMENGVTHSIAGKGFYLMWVSGGYVGKLYFPFNENTNLFDFRSKELNYMMSRDPWEKIDYFFFIENSSDLTRPLLFMEFNSGQYCVLFYLFGTEYGGPDMPVSNYQTNAFSSNRIGYKILYAFSVNKNQIACILSNGTNVYRDLYSITSDSQTTSIKTSSSSALTSGVNILKGTIGMIKYYVPFKSTGIIVASSGLITSGEHQGEYLCYIFGVFNGNLATVNNGNGLCSFYTTKPPLIKKLKYETIVLGFKGERVSSCYMIETVEQSNGGTSVKYNGAFEAITISDESGEIFSSNFYSVIAALDGKFYLLSLGEGGIKFTDICNAIAVRRANTVINGVSLTSINGENGKISCLPIKI